MKYKYNSSTGLLIFSLILFLAFSCETENYPIELSNGNEAALGEIKSLEIRPGKNRVLVKGTVDDPQVAEIKISWSDGSESLSVPVNVSAEREVTISREIENLEERLYIFEVSTFDDAGNSSNSVTAGAEVYGEEFISTLENRPIESNKLIDTTYALTFGSMDLSTGVIGTEIIYENTDGEETELFIGIDDNDFSVSNFESGSTYRYRTLYVPSSIVIDTFYTAYESKTPQPFPVLKNAAVPFEAAETNGRWGTLAIWNTNEAAKNHGGYGGWDEWNGNIFNLESGWGSPDIINGKIYQVVLAGSGSYSLNVNILSTNHDLSDEGGAYFVIAKGDDGLPDVENVTSSSEVIAYERITAENLSYSINFTIEETTEISVGKITTQLGNRFCNIISFEIVPQ